MSKITRRSVLGLAAGGLAAATAGCAQGGGTDPTPPAGTSQPGTQGDLYVAWYGGAPVHQAMESALALFEARHEEITTTGSGIAFGDYWDRLATETAGGSSPDVFRMSMTYFVEYARRGALHDLTGNSIIDLSSLDTDVRDSGLVEGNLLGVGQSSIAPAIFSSQAMLDRAGAEVPTEWTWDEYAAWIKEFSNEAGPDAWGTSDLGGNFQMFDVFARQEIGNQFSEDGELLLTESVVEHWFAFWEDLRQAGAAPPPDITVESTTFETNPMTVGQAALTAGWIQQIAFFQPLITDGVVSASPLPQKTRGDFSGLFVKALDFWCISAQSEHQEAAALLVDHLINDPDATSEIGLLLGVPPTEAARSQLADADDATNAAIDYVEEYGPLAGDVPGPWPMGYGECLDAFSRANEAVGFGSWSPSEAAASFISEAQNAIGG